MLLGEAPVAKRGVPGSLGLPRRERAARMARSAAALGGRSAAAVSHPRGTGPRSSGGAWGDDDDGLADDRAFA